MKMILQNIVPLYVSIVPAGAQGLVLEAVEGGTTNGTVVSVNKLLGKAHQKWHIILKEAGCYTISRVYAASGSWVAFRGGHEFPKKNFGRTHYGHSPLSHHTKASMPIKLLFARRRFS